MNAVATPKRWNPSVTQPAVLTGEALTVLRDTAYVLLLTRRVKDAILDCKPLPGAAVCESAQC